MWKYIVTWMIIETHSIPCPVASSISDEFGRQREIGFQTAINCLRTDTTKMIKLFFTRKETVDFISRGQADKEGTLFNFKLDSIKTSDK